MQVVYPRCCGLDIHKKSIVACVLLTDSDGTLHRFVRTFGTMTADLLGLDDWLSFHAVTHVALESTGVLWRPVFNVLEEGRTLLVNALHIKALPGHKTDVKDSEWLADLLRHGLLHPSFIPPQPIRVLRDLTRYRKSLVEQRTQQINRIHKVLETANIKLGAVASNVVGASGRRMLEAIEHGEADSEVLAELAKGRLREKLPALRLALTGRVQAHHRLLIGELLDHAAVRAPLCAPIGGVRFPGNADTCRVLTHHLTRLVRSSQPGVWERDIIAVFRAGPPIEFSGETPSSP